MKSEKFYIIYISYLKKGGGKVYAPHFKMIYGAYIWDRFIVCVSRDKVADANLKKISFSERFSKFYPPNKFYKDKPKIW